MKKHILIFGAGKSATSLIDYLKNQLAPNNWTLTVADNDPVLAEEKTAGAPGTSSVGINVMNVADRQILVSKADLVISLLPPALHHLVATDCCLYNKHLLTASYVSEEIKRLTKEIEAKQLIFLCEMGLDPGIDHMSAMQIIHRLKSENAQIQSFTSHCGGLVAPASDDNPWHYKISWNPSNVVKAGSDGAQYRENGAVRLVPYEELFENCPQLNVASLGTYAYYPNRDSLNYIDLYDLKNTDSFLRTTLRHPAFCSGWAALVKAGLTRETPVSHEAGISYRQWSHAVTPFLNEQNREQLEYLGLFEQSAIPSHLGTNASVLQFLLDKKLMLRGGDKDMVVMVHEFVYTVKGKTYRLTSSMIVKGENQLHTAMAKTVGLPLGIAAKLILQQKLLIYGLQIPISKEIYQPVLEELSKAQITFTETVEEITKKSV